MALPERDIERMSLQERLALLPKDERVARLEAMTDKERIVLAGWGGSSRPVQREPVGSHDWTYWALIGGRGSGKTRAAAEWVCDRVEGTDSQTRNPVEFRARYVGLIARSAADARRVMIDGESGLTACAEARGMKVLPNPSRAQLTIVCPDGHVATCTWYSAEEPDSLRGPQHDTVWGDEFAAWARKIDAVGNTAFTNATATLRLGPQPRGVFTTTPKVSAEMKRIYDDDTGSWIRTRMTTWENAANLPPSYISVLRRQYPEGSRLAQQEFEGLLLEEVEGALWSIESIRATRIEPPKPLPLLVHRAVAVDPSIGWRGEGNECGIVGGGLTEHMQFVVAYDYSVEASPDDWADQVVRCCRALDTNVVVAEGNQGGAMVEAILKNHDPSLRVETVFAKDSKRARAEPVAQLWDTKRGGLYGFLPELEGQLTGWSGLEGESPDRLDALVWLGFWAMKRMFYGPPQFSSVQAQIPDEFSEVAQVRVAAGPPGRPSRAERLAKLDTEGGRLRRRGRHRRAVIR